LIHAYYSRIFSLFLCFTNRWVAWICAGNTSLPLIEAYCQCLINLVVAQGGYLMAVLKLLVKATTRPLPPPPSAPLPPATPSAKDSKTPALVVATPEQVHSQLITTFQQ
jgi:hypothetical protein